VCDSVDGGTERFGENKFYVHVTNSTSLQLSFVIKPTKYTNFTNLLCHETLHVSESSSVPHQEFIHCTLNNGICHTAFEQDQDGTAVPSWSSSKAVYIPV
jgi:hypothetical protein